MADLAIEGRQLVSAGDAVGVGPEELSDLEQAVERPPRSSTS